MNAVLAEAPAFTEAVIARALVRFNSMFPPRRYLCVENVSWGLLPWEADLLCMSGSGFLQEVEIKISVSDLRRDLVKAKHRHRFESVVVGGRAYNTWIKWFWYAMPKPIWKAVESAPPIPDDAGVLALSWYPGNSDSYFPDKARFVHEIVRKPKTNKLARPLTDSERYDLARLGVLRYWNRLNPEDPHHG